MAQVNVGDEVRLMIPFKVFRILPNGKLDICDVDGDCISVNSNQILKLTNNMKQMKDAVLTVAKELAKPNNTVTTLDIKVQLRRDYPYYFWDQKTVSQYMDQLAGDGIFTFTDNGTYRTYSLVQVAQSKANAVLTKAVKASPAIAVTNSGVTVTKVQKTKIDQVKLSQLATDSDFAGVTLANGTIVSRQDIKGQKKSPLGYITPKLGKIQSIVVGTTQYNVK